MVKEAAHSGGLGQLMGMVCQTTCAHAWKIQGEWQTANIYSRVTV